MKVKISGTILAVREGVSKKTGKPYRFADIYDGDKVVRLFDFPDGFSAGVFVEDILVNVSFNGSVFAHVAHHSE